MNLRMNKTELSGFDFALKSCVIHGFLMMNSHVKMEWETSMKLIRPELFITLHIPPHLPDTNLINLTDISLRKQYLLTTFPEVTLESHTMLLPFPTSVLVMLWIQLPPLSSALTTRGTSLITHLQRSERRKRRLSYDAI